MDRCATFLCNLQMIVRALASSGGPANLGGKRRKRRTAAATTTAMVTTKTHGPGALTCWTGSQLQEADADSRDPGTGKVPL